MKETVIKNFATLLAAGVLALGAAGCKDDGASADPPVSPPASPSASGGSAGTTPGPVTSPVPTPTLTPPKKPKVTGSDIVMIDPDGKKYTREKMIQLAAGMAAVSGRLPSNFCAKSYQEGAKGGGKFPAGELAFLEACKEGVALGG